MSDRSVLAADLMYYSEIRHRECRRVLRRLQMVQLAIEAVQRGERGAAGMLVVLCREDHYGRQLPDVDLSELIGAETERCDLADALEEMDGQPEPDGRFPAA